MVFAIYIRRTTCTERYLPAFLATDPLSHLRWNDCMSSSHYFQTHTRAYKAGSGMWMFKCRIFFVEDFINLSTALNFSTVILRFCRNLDFVFDYGSFLWWFQWRLLKIIQSRSSWDIFGFSSPVGATIWAIIFRGLMTIIGDMHPVDIL